MAEGRGEAHPPEKGERFEGGLASHEEVRCLVAHAQYAANMLFHVTYLADAGIHPAGTRVFQPGNDVLPWLFERGWDRCTVAVEPPQGGVIEGRSRVVRVRFEADVAAAAGTRLYAVASRSVVIQCFRGYSIAKAQEGTQHFTAAMMRDTFDLFKRDIVAAISSQDTLEEPEDLTSDECQRLIRLIQL